MSKGEQRIREQINKCQESRERIYEEISKLDKQKSKLLDHLTDLTEEMEILISELKFEQDRDYLFCKCGCYLTQDYILETTENEWVLCPFCEEDIEMGYTKVRRGNNDNR